MQIESSIHLCLLAHCISVPQSPTPLAHPELFIPLADLDRLLCQLHEDKFLFCLPNDAPPGAPKTCSFTFDDGYANNAHFLSLAEKHRLPFVLFVSSINIAEQLPFLWDVASLAGSGRIRMIEDYRLAYQHLDPGAARKLLRDENHRPFQLDELRAFADCELTHLALHTHSHQPLVGRFLSGAGLEIEENLKFLSQFPRVLSRDFALPCGFYTPGTAKFFTKNLVDRVYTIDGGAAAPGSSIIHRISLINPKMGGALMSQVRNSFSWKAKFRRKLVNIRYSAPVLNRI